MALKSDQVWRDHNVDGDPSSGYFSPSKPLIREWGTAVENIAVGAASARDAAEDARDLAQGYASDAISQGNVPIYSSRTSAAAATIPAGITYVRLNGFASAGDGGAARYRVVASEPSHQGKFQDQGGRWFEIDEYVVTPFMFGGVPGAETNSLSALSDTLNYCKEKIENDNRRQMVLDLAGERWAINDTWSFNGRTDYLTVQNGKILALDVAWADVDAGLNTYFDQYQTVTTAGETWSLRKPLIKCAGSNPGLVFERVDLDGARRAAGILCEDSAKGRKFRNGNIYECRSYSVFADGTLTVEDSGIRCATSNIGDRDAYGIVADANGTRIVNTRVRWAHCLALTTGDEIQFLGCDFENGEASPSGSLPTILWENRGSDNTFSGGRLRNGQVRTWNMQMAVVGTNCGNEEEQHWKNFFRFYATTNNQDLSGFVFIPVNVPDEMVSGSTTWFNFTTVGQASWGIDTASIGEIQGYPNCSGGVVQHVAPGTSSTAVIYRSSTTNAVKAKFATNGVPNDAAPWVGAEGYDGQLGNGNSAYWTWTDEGHFKPTVAGGGKIGTQSQPVERVHAENETVVTSDGRVKRARDLTDAEIAAALAIRSRAYTRTDIDDPDVHFGVIAQDVAEAFGGVDNALKYGFLQYAEDRFSVAYTELDQIRIEAHSREIQRLNEIIETLTDRLDRREAN